MKDNSLSSASNRSWFSQIDWITLGLLLSLMSIGWTMIFAVTYQGEEDVLRKYVLNLDTLPGKQLLWIGVALLIIVLVQFLDERFWHTMAYIVYGVTILSLIMVAFAGTEIKGARSWFTFGGFSLQPSEFAKFGTALAMAAYLSTYSTDLRRGLHQLLAALIFTFPALLIMLQPDAGSALIFVSFLLVMYREGMPPVWYSIGFLIITLLICSLKFGFEWVALGLLLIPNLLLSFEKNTNQLYWRWSILTASALLVYIFVSGYVWESIISGGVLLVSLLLYQYRFRRGRFVVPILSIVLLGGAFSFATDFAFQQVLKPHQQDRINVWLRPELSDPSGSAYNLEHSKIAIGSGGLLGKGYLNGIMTKGNMVPEQSTDFIFTTVGEEHGFIGSILIIGLFAGLLLRLSMLAERQKTDFSRLYIYGVIGILFVHFLVNIGMTIGLLPIIGIPLPFISYGGSSLMGFTLMMGVLLRLDSERLER